jgi:hypothetical protein
MKSSLFMFSLVLLSGLTAHAQEMGMNVGKLPNASGASGLKLVPTIGYSASGSDSQGDATTTVLPKAGVTAGLLVELGRGTVKGQTGLVYFQNGYKLNYLQSVNGSPTAGTAEGRLYSIGLPILGKMESRLTSGNVLYGKGGVIPSYVAAARIQDSLANSNGGTQGSGGFIATKDGINEFNVMGQLGVGFSNNMNANRDFRFELLYNRSLMPVNSAGANQLYTTSFMLNVAMGIEM